MSHLSNSIKDHRTFATIDESYLMKRSRQNMRGQPIAEGEIRKKDLLTVVVTKAPSRKDDLETNAILLNMKKDYDVEMDQYWLFDVDSWTIIMNYVQYVMQEIKLMIRWEDDQSHKNEFERLLQQEKQTVHPNNTNNINTVSTPVSTAGPSCTDDDLSSPVNAAEASNAFEEHLKHHKVDIEAARTMLVDSKLPTTFWAKAVNTACYVLNRVLIIKSHNKTPYELIRGRSPLIDFMKPFGCPVTIINNRDHLGKFDGKADEGFLLGIGPDWLFDVDSLTISMNYVPVVAGNQTNGIVETRDNIVTGHAEKKTEPEQEYILIPICTTDPLISQDPKVREEDAEEKPTEMVESGASNKDGKDDQATRINAAEASNAFEEHLFERFSPFKNAFTLPPVSNVTLMDDTRIFGNAYDDEDVGAEADLNNLVSTQNEDKSQRLSKLLICLFSLSNGTKKGIPALQYPSWIEAIRLFLAYASFMGFIVYQVDVKSAFLYSTIEEEVYVCQPLGFEDPRFPNKVYKVYVDDIIFGSTKKTLCDEFEGLMHKRFQMSSMGELTFFLGLQVQQKEDGIFISQDKYVAEILKKFDFGTVKTASTPIETNKALVKDEEAEAVDVHLYRSMIGFLKYLTASRPDIMFVVCACARDSPFDLEAFSDSDYAGASLDRKSTIGEYVAAANCCGQMRLSIRCGKNNGTGLPLLLSSFRCGTDQCKHKLRPIHNATLMDVYFLWELIHVVVSQVPDTIIRDVDAQTSRILGKTWGSEKCMGFMKLIDFLNANQILYAFNCQSYYLTHLALNNLGTAKAKRFNGGIDCLTNCTIFEELARMGVVRIDLKLTDLMNYVLPKLSERVLDLNITKTGSKLREVDDAEMFDTDALIGNEVFAENDMIEKDQDVIPKEVSTAAPSTTAVSQPVITEYRVQPQQHPSTIPKAKGITFRDAGESTTRTPTSVSSSSIKDKGKVKMDELEVPLKKKDQIVLDEEMARNLEAQIQAELIEEEGLQGNGKGSHIALIESWVNTQAMWEADLN
ncbi:putative ribonuclease H-like domain-containing protein [Tanacetum coccineum]